MGLLLAFAPFIVFVIVERLAGPRMGLTAATLVSGGLLLRDRQSRNRAVKVLEIGTFLLFGGLAAYAIASGAAWSVVGVRPRVDAGLLLMVLVSIAIRRPFTLSYAREETPQEMWSNPAFIRTNYIITAVWALAFAVMVSADLVMLYLPNLPLKIGIGATILAIAGAIRFTSWYTDHMRDNLIDCTQKYERCLLPMKRLNPWLIVSTAALAAFLAGRWSSFNTSVRADSGAAPQIEIRPVGGDSSLTVYYPNLNKLFVYQSPFVGLPKWNCSYSIQLSEPGGQIERKPCSNPGQLF